MLKAEESCPPDIVEDNYTGQVMSASLVVIQSCVVLVSYQYARMLLYRGSYMQLTNKKKTTQLLYLQKAQHWGMLRGLGRCFCRGPFYFNFSFGKIYSRS